MMVIDNCIAINYFFEKFDVNILFVLKIKINYCQFSNFIN